MIIRNANNFKQLSRIIVNHGRIVIKRHDTQIEHRLIMVLLFYILFFVKSKYFIQIFIAILLMI